MIHFSLKVATYGVDLGSEKVLAMLAESDEEG